MCYTFNIMITVMYNLSKLHIERTRPTKPFPYLSFRLSAEGSGEEPNKKLKRKWFWSGGRPKYEGDGAVLSSYAPRRAREKACESVPLPIGDFLQKKFGFHPKGTANLRFCQFRQNCEQSKALHKSRFARKGLNLKAFATLRVGKKKVLGFGFGSSSCLSSKNNCTGLCTSFAFAKQPIFFVSPIGETWKR